MVPTRIEALLTAAAMPRRRPRPRLVGLPAPGPAPPHAPTPSTPTYDYSADPLLASERANALTDYQAQQHAIDARRRSALIGFGSRGLAMKTLGLGADNPLIQSIDENADTGTNTLARLAHDYAANQRTSDENLNRGNLFFSSTRTKALGDLAYANQQRITDATTQIQNLLEGLTEQGAGAASAYGSRLSAAEQGAMGRELDFNLQYPQSPSIDSTLGAIAAAAAKPPAGKRPASRRPAAARILAARRPR